MKDQQGTRTWPALVLIAIVLAFAAATLLLAVLDVDSNAGRDEGLLIPATCFALVGGFIIARDSSNRIGWIFYGVGFAWASGSFAVRYSTYGATEGGVPGWMLAAWYQEWYWLPWLFLLLAAAPVLFPDGKLPSRKWRPVMWLIAAGAVGLSALASLDSTLNLQGGGGRLDNPIGISPFGDPDEAPLMWIFMLMLWTSAIASLTALIVRFRRARGDERQQMKWFVYAAVIVFVSFITLIFVEQTTGQRPPLLDPIFLSLPPIAAGIAILKYRLYDIDVVINKTIVFGALAAFITVIYVAIVVGIGAALGSRDEPNLVLSIAATAIVAIAFSPVKERTQRIANRLVYGRRATPYEALSRFSDEVATSYETEQVAPAMARTIVEATGADRAEVWLALDHSLVRAAAQPEGTSVDVVLPLPGDGSLPVIAGADIAVPLAHHGELLGAIALTKKRGEAPSPIDHRLLEDLSSQAGIVLRNSRLTAELSARVDQITATASEIRESRRRLVEAQDQSRRRLERDIHDGAQQHLVALAVKLNLAKTMAGRKPERAGSILAQLKDEAGDALETLDELARGIYPPLLAEAGIGRAIATRAVGASFVVEVEVEDLTTARYGESIEAACYFCILEALQNVAKHAKASIATVTLREEGGALVFTVADDGEGFDPRAAGSGSGVEGMSDRLAAVGGELTITSAPGGGTTIAGIVPVVVQERAS